MELIKMRQGPDAERSHNAQVFEDITPCILTNNSVVDL